MQRLWLTQSPVGAGLLAKALYQSTNRLADTPHSRASPLPQGICDAPFRRLAPVAARSQVAHHQPLFVVPGPKALQHGRGNPTSVSRALQNPATHRPGHCFSGSSDD
ncbi:hypothetical protein C3E98_018335 [Pseudomonas sp. MWU13-2625]|nr:hypothetical protein C3E98_018335 [Pseudomonas sp. MWU13-2625]